MSSGNEDYKSEDNSDDNKAAFVAEEVDEHDEILPHYPSMNLRATSKK